MDGLDEADEVEAEPPLGDAVRIDRARRRLCGVLIGQQEAAASSRCLAELSQAARWPLPDTVRAVVLSWPGEIPQLATALGNALAGPVQGDVCLLVPDPGPYDEIRDVVQGVLRGRAAAIGHVVPLGVTASSVRWASRLLELGPGDGAGEERVLVVDEYLSELLMLQDESLTRALAARWLQPLDELTPRQSARFERTLLAWLEGGGVPEAAKILEVHPQTVRYRMRQVEKLFGPALRDPRSRFELEMTLRGRRLLARMRHHRLVLGRGARATGDALRSFDPVRQARVNGL
ncbi:PucR family transcriptional regulator [Streptomyces boninensis]|uniref:PucR family transcriptional regulator n=1 Tax=Streptomyces boninensis TaxID=2039455 RepID=UPI003B210AF8